MGPNLPHLWRNRNLDDLPLHSPSIKATAVYFPEAFLLTMTDDPIALSASQHLLSQASRGIRFGRVASQHLQEYIQRMDASQGLERLAHFLGALALVERTQDFKLLASEGYRNRTTTYDIDRYTSIYQYLLQNFHQDVSLDDVVKSGYGPADETAFAGLQAGITY